MRRLANLLLRNTYHGEAEMPQRVICRCSAVSLVTRRVTISQMGRYYVPVDEHDPFESLAGKTGKH